VLLSLGLTYCDLQSIPAEKAEALLLLHNEIKTYEKEELEKQKRKSSRR
jgi:hypothetical protein